MEPSLKEVEEVIKAVHSASSPGFVGVLQPHLKALPRAYPTPVEDFEDDFAKGDSSWPVKMGRQSLDSQGGGLEKHQPVSDNLTIECRRKGAFLLKNNYIDAAVQKGVIPGAPSGLEHTGVVT